MQHIIRYVISYLHQVVSVYVGYYHVRYLVLTEGSKCICRILSGTLFRTYRRLQVYMYIIRYVISYFQKVVSVYVGYYQVRYFVLTKDCKNICRILSGTLFRTYRRQYVYMQDIIRYVISFLQKVVSIYVTYYQVRYFVLT